MIAIFDVGSRIYFVEPSHGLQLSKQFVIGLPLAGKTTFLAALWHVVNSGEVDGSLDLEILHGDQEYLNEIRDLWADANILERTKIGHERFVSMRLKKPDRNHSTEIIFPDLSGESFELQWTQRWMKSEHVELTREAIGGLLLVHAEQKYRETLMSDTRNIVRILEKKLSGEDEQKLPAEQAGETREHEHAAGPPFDPAKSPKQVQLVDLLQFVAAINPKRPMKLAVIVSAWDRVRESLGKELSPHSWVENNLPLLTQYLTANGETFCSRFYGVSAQGGKLEDAGELRKVIHPADRILVVEDDLSESHDITAPVQWILG